MSVVCWTYNIPSFFILEDLEAVWRGIYEELFKTKTENEMNRSQFIFRVFSLEYHDERRMILNFGMKGNKWVINNKNRERNESFSVLI